MRTYKEQTAFILEKVNQRKNTDKKLMKYINSLTLAAACLIITLSGYVLLTVLWNTAEIPVTPLKINLIEPNTGETDDSIGGGGPGGCVHYNSDVVYSEHYHSIPGIISSFVYDPNDPDAFDRWVEEANRLSAENATEQCDSRYATIDFFIEYFDIKREDFEKLYYNTELYSIYDYNIDVLYSGDKDLIEQYYTEFSAERISEMESRREVWESKDTLVKETFGIIMLDGESMSKEYETWVRSLDKDNIIEWFEKNGANQYGWFYVANSLWSIPEFIDYWESWESTEEYEPVTAVPNEDLLPPPVIF